MLTPSLLFPIAIYLIRLGHGSIVLDAHGLICRGRCPLHEWAEPEWVAGAARRSSNPNARPVQNYKMGRLLLAREGVQSSCTHNQRLGLLHQWLVPRIAG